MDIYIENINTIFNRIGKILENLNHLPQEKIEASITESENGIKEAERIVRKKFT